MAPRRRKLAVVVFDSRLQELLMYRRCWSRRRIICMPLRAELVVMMVVIQYRYFRRSILTHVDAVCVHNSLQRRIRQRLVLLSVVRTLLILWNCTRRRGLEAFPGILWCPTPSHPRIHVLSKVAGAFDILREYLLHLLFRNVDTQLRLNL